MNFGISFLSFSIAAVLAINNYSDTYKNFLLYNVFPDQVHHVNILNTLNTRKDVEFWESFITVNRTQNVMVSSSINQTFEAVLRSNGLKYKMIVYSYVKNLIDEQKRRMQNQAFDWSAFMTLEEINNWLDELLEKHADVVSLVTIGRSHEGRELKGIIINHNKNQENNTIIGIIEGTIHAREWMSAAAVTWIIKELVTSNDHGIRRMAANVEWHIFPVLNPDGYVYSFEKRRFWKKNRNKNYFRSCDDYGVEDDLSNGADLNRNFNIGWMAAKSASNNPCSNNFGGSYAFSEQESLFFSDYVEWKKEHANVLYYIALHETNQPIVLIPYGHTVDGQTIESPNYDAMYRSAMRGANKVKRKYGVQYKVGLAPDILYPTSSSSIDHMKYVTDAPRTFQIGIGGHELGLLVHPRNIISTCKQVTELLVEIDRSWDGTEVTRGKKRYEHPQKYSQYEFNTKP